MIVLQQEWISVEERLPTMQLVHMDDEDGGWLMSEPALALNGNKVEIACAVFDRELRWVTEHGDDFVSFLWMPLPEPPKGVREDG